MRTAGLQARSWLGSKPNLILRSRARRGVSKDGQRHDWFPPFETRSCDPLLRVRFSVTKLAAIFSGPRASRSLRVMSEPEARGPEEHEKIAPMERRAPSKA
jgi:hypothetical protein